MYARLARGRCGGRLPLAPAQVVRVVTRRAPLAQSAERLHGKEKVYGSIP